MSVSLLTGGVQIPSGVDGPLRFDSDLHALRIYKSPSMVAIKGFEVAAANGWTTWRVAGRDTTLADLRSRLEVNET